MSELRPFFGIALLLVTCGLLFVFTMPRKTSARPRRAPLRSIRGMLRLRRALGLAVEDGTRLHLSLGKASILSPNSASAFVALSALERIGMQSSLSDSPPVATSGDGTLALLSHDALQAAYRQANAIDQFDASQARLAGITPFSYAAGTLPVIHDEDVSANLLIGNFGPEVALMAHAAEQENAVVVAASDSIAAQAVLYAAAEEPLLGEEVFTIPAYLSSRPIHYASVRVQDLLRWLVIIVLVLGALARLFFPDL